MKLLLDSCVFLWMINGDDKIPENIKNEILNPLNDVYLSSISITEIVIKAQIGKLEIPKPHGEFLISLREKHQIKPLDLTEKDLLILEKLPDNHSDPFDRLLICQTINNSMSIVTSDTQINRYPVNTLFF